MPFGGGNTDLTRSRLTSCRRAFEAITPATDRLRVDCWKSAHFTFTVTVRARRPVCSHHLHTSSAIARTPASIAGGSTRSSLNVVSEPDDLRTLLVFTGRWSMPRAIAWNHGPDLPN